MEVNERTCVYSYKTRDSTSLAMEAKSLWITSWVVKCYPPPCMGTPKK